MEYSHRLRRLQRYQINTHLRNASDITITMNSNPPPAAPQKLSEATGPTLLNPSDITRLQTVSSLLPNIESHNFDYTKDSKVHTRESIENDVKQETHRNTSHRDPNITFLSNNASNVVEHQRNQPLLFSYSSASSSVSQHTNTVATTNKFKDSSPLFSLPPPKLSEPLSQLVIPTTAQVTQKDSSINYINEANDECSTFVVHYDSNESGSGHTSSESSSCSETTTTAFRHSPLPTTRYNLRTHNADKIPLPCIINRGPLLNKILSANEDLLFPVINEAQINTTKPKKQAVLQFLRSILTSHEFPYVSSPKALLQRCDVVSRGLHVVLPDKYCCNNPSAFRKKDSTQRSCIGWDTVICYLLIQSLETSSIRLAFKLTLAGLFNSASIDDADISISQTIARAAGIKGFRHPVQVTLLNYPNAILDYAEIMIGDRYFSRRDMLHFERLLYGEVLYQNSPPECLPHTFIVRSLLIDTSSSLVHTCSIHHDSDCGASGRREAIRQLFPAAGIYAPGVSITENVSAALSGIVGDKTKFTYRSKCQQMFLMIQLSEEMWWYAADGRACFFHVEDFLTQLFRRYRNGGQKHYLTIVLFYRLHVLSHDDIRNHQSTITSGESNNNNNEKRPDIFLLKWGADRPRTHNAWAKAKNYTYYTEDRFDIIWEGPLPVLLQKKREAEFFKRLRRDFLEFPQSVGWEAPCFLTEDRRGNQHESWQSKQDYSLRQEPKTATTPSSTFRETKRQHKKTCCPAWAAQPTLAAYGNVLEAINMVLDQFAVDHIDRSLIQTGQGIIILTAGNGILYCSDHNLARLTKQRLNEHVVAPDVVCLREAPLNRVPLIMYNLQLPYSHSSPLLTSTASFSGSSPHCDEDATLFSANKHLYPSRSSESIFHFDDFCSVVYNSTKNVNEVEATCPRTPPQSPSGSKGATTNINRMQRRCKKPSKNAYVLPVFSSSAVSSPHLDSAKGDDSDTGASSTSAPIYPPFFNGKYAFEDIDWFVLHIYKPAQSATSLLLPPSDRRNLEFPDPSFSYLEEFSLAAREHKLFEDFVPNLGYTVGQNLLKFFNKNVHEIKVPPLRTSRLELGQLNPIVLPLKKTEKQKPSSTLFLQRNRTAEACSPMPVHRKNRRHHNTLPTDQEQQQQLHQMHRIRWRPPVFVPTGAKPGQPGKLLILNPFSQQPVLVSNKANNTQVREVCTRRWSHVYSPPREGSIQWESLLHPATLPLTTEFFFYHRLQSSRPTTFWTVTAAPTIFDAFRWREILRSGGSTEIFVDTDYIIKLLMFDLIAIRLAQNLQVTQANCNLHLLQSVDGRPQSVQTWLNDAVYELCLIDEGRNILVECLTIPQGVDGALRHWRDHALTLSYQGCSTASYFTTLPKAARTSIKKNLLTGNGYSYSLWSSGGSHTEKFRQHITPKIERNARLAISSRRSRNASLPPLHQLFEKHKDQYAHLRCAAPDTGNTGFIAYRAVDTALTAHNSVTCALLQVIHAKERKKSTKHKTRPLTQNYDSSLISASSSPSSSSNSSSLDNYQTVPSVLHSSHIENTLEEQCHCIPAEGDPEIIETSQQQPPVNLPEPRNLDGRKKNQRTYAINSRTKYKDSTTSIQMPPQKIRIKTSWPEQYHHYSLSSITATKIPFEQVNNVRNTLFIDKDLSVEENEEKKVEQDTNPFLESEANHSEHEGTLDNLTCFFTVDTNNEKLLNSPCTSFIKGGGSNIVIRQPRQTRKYSSISDTSHNSALTPPLSLPSNSYEQGIDEDWNGNLHVKEQHLQNVDYCSIEKPYSKNSELKTHGTVSPSLRFYPTPSNERVDHMLFHMPSDSVRNLGGGGGGTDVTTSRSVYTSPRTQILEPSSLSSHYDDTMSDFASAMHSPFSEKQSYFCHNASEEQPPTTPLVTYSDYEHRVSPSPLVPVCDSFDYYCLVRHRGMNHWANSSRFLVPLDHLHECDDYLFRQHGFCTALLLSDQSTLRKPYHSPYLKKIVLKKDSFANKNQKNDIHYVYSPLDSYPKPSLHLLDKQLVQKDSEMPRSRSIEINTTTHSIKTDDNYENSYKHHQQRSCSLNLPHKANHNSTHVNTRVLKRFVIYLARRRSNRSKRATYVTTYHHPKSFKYYDQKPISLGIPWQPVFRVFETPRNMYFNILDEIVTWQRAPPPVADTSDGFCGALLGIRNVTFALVHRSIVSHYYIPNGRTAILKNSQRLGNDPFGLSTLHKLFDAYSEVVAEAKNLKASMENLLLKHAPNMCKNKNVEEHITNTEGVQNNDFSNSSKSKKQSETVYSKSLRPTLNFSVEVPSKGFSSLGIESTRIVSSWCNSLIWCPPRSTSTTTSMPYFNNNTNTNNSGSDNSSHHFIETNNNNNLSSSLLYSSKSPLSRSLSPSSEASSSSLTLTPDLLRAPHTPLDWFTLNYDSHFFPPFPFVLSIEWIVCASLFISRLVNRLRIAAACHGFCLIQLPVAQLLSRVPTVLPSDYETRRHAFQYNIPSISQPTFYSYNHYARPDLNDYRFHSFPSYDQEIQRQQRLKRFVTIASQYHSNSNVIFPEVWHFTRLLPFHPPKTIYIVPLRSHATKKRNCYNLLKHKTISAGTYNKKKCQLLHYMIFLNLLQCHALQLLFLRQRSFQACCTSLLAEEVFRLEGQTQEGWLLIERYGRFFVHITRMKVIFQAHYLSWIQSNSPMSSSSHEHRKEQPLLTHFKEEVGVRTFSAPAASTTKSVNHMNNCDDGYFLTHRIVSRVAQKLGFQTFTSDVCGEANLPRCKVNSFLYD